MKIQKYFIRVVEHLKGGTTAEVVMMMNIYSSDSIGTRPVLSGNFLNNSSIFHCYL